MTQTATRPFAIVTGASSGIGFELAKICGESGFDLLIAADEPRIQSAAECLRGTGASVEAIEVDLAEAEGVERLVAAAQGRPVDVLLANAGEGMGGAFLDQDFEAVRHVVGTNIIGTIHLVHLIGQDMRLRRSGRIMVTGSVAGFAPGSFQAVYNASKAFIDSFCYALRDELTETGVTVTCLMPGATDTNFFERAEMMDTKIGTAAKDDPAMVARVGFDAMMKGDADVVTGWTNKIAAAAASLVPSETLARLHRKQAEPGTAE